MKHLATSLPARLLTVLLAVFLVATACGSDADTSADLTSDRASSSVSDASDDSGATDVTSGSSDETEAPAEAGDDAEGMFDDSPAEPAVDDASDAIGVDEDDAAEEEAYDDDSAGEAMSEGDSGSLSSSVPPAAAAGGASTDGGERAADELADSAALAESAGKVDAEGDIIEPEPPRPLPTPEPPRPQAGLLTAGDIDDNLNLDYFAQLVGNWQQEAGRGVPYVELRDRIVVDYVGTNGVGIGNTELTIAAGQSRHTVVTNSAGRAFIYPTWMGLDMDDRITISSDHGNWGFDAEATAEEGSIEIAADGDTTPPGSIDIALVLDVTGSMADELRYLTVEFESIVARLEADYGNVDMRFALIVYRDTGDEFVTRVFDFTDSVSEMRNQLADQFANGGGDFPEAMDAALLDAEELSWSRGDDVARVLILNADAPPHNEKIATALNAARDLGEEGVRIYPLAASGVDRNAEFIMRAMAVTTGGRHMFLTGDSGIGGAKLEPKAECYLVTGLDDLLYRVLASELAGERIEPTDGQIVRSVGQYDRGECA